jgi:hypothetical protein
METKVLCEMHKINFLKCAHEGCNKVTICKLCALKSKEEATHLYEHFDYLKEEFKHDLSITLNKDEELYQDLNKYVEEFTEKTGNTIEGLFNELAKGKIVITTQISNGIIAKYSKITEDFEINIKDINEKISNLNVTDRKSKQEFLHIKNSLDVKLKEISENELIAKEFNSLSNIIKKLNSNTLNDVLEQKIKADYPLRGGENFNKWTNGTNLLTIQNKSGSYYCEKSETIVEGRFECQLYVKKLINKSANSMWWIGFGLIRGASNEQNSYYMDSACLYSTGQLNAPFQGANGTTLFYDTWKTGDNIYMKRDENNDVWFAMNSKDDYKKAFNRLDGQFRIVMGFINSISTQDEFELVELRKY